MWFLAPEFRQRYERAIVGGYQPTAEQSAQWAAGFGVESAENLPRILTIAGDTAEILIAGILTPKPDFFAFLFGGGNTTYGDILAALAFAEQSADVTNIILTMDSPGGQIAGLFEVLDAIAATTKPVTAKTRVALSAAYAIASQADTITAENQASAFGSIGIAMSVHVDPDTVDIASTDAPNKRPDVTTPEGRAVMREQLDAVHEIFVQAIARGRNMTAKKVNDTFGRGSNVLAADALARGMIDGMAASAAQSAQAIDLPPAAIAAPTQEASIMDLQKLRAEYPGLVAQIETEAAASATTAERERATAHLIMGASSDCMDIAIAAVKDGSAMTATHNAEYMAAGIRKAGAAAATTDDDAAAKALAEAGGDGATDAAPDAGGISTAALDLLDASLGLPPPAAVAA